MKLLFVYNANSGKFNAMLDIAHKAISPSTYQCSLCAITHDTFSVKSEWDSFKQSTSHDMEFLHKDEFESRYNERYEYPVILEMDGGIKVLLSREEIELLGDVKELIADLNAR